MGSAVMTNVYNHYLAAYAPKGTSRYDTHKKSELRSIYNSIVKLNKESPWYLETTSRSAQEYAVNLKESARLFHNTIASLGGLDDSQALAKKTAYSSDPDTVSVSYIKDTADADTAAPVFTIQVNRLAASQENMGVYLQDSEVSLAPDTYSFDVAVNGLNYEFQFNINEGDTNRQVQQRLVRLINNAGIGIHAQLDEGAARSSIRLCSAASGLSEGRSEIFRITDERTSKSAGAVEYFGLDYISRMPANSSFLLNGEERSTASNTFTISGMYEIELKGISQPDTEVTVGLKTDMESLTDNVSSLIGGYNTFISAASSYRQTQSLSGRLVKEMSRIAAHYQTGMADMGIRLQPDSTLAIDEEVLKESASSPDGGFSYDTLRDFAASLVRKTSQVSLDPMHYVDRTIVAYKNPGHNFASPYITSAYSGMMFNSYC